ncbi:MAG: hypothetical protein IJU60_00130 [Acholeplasmatales bacterium]|nr:hypothetical protein [Acholeplasmatales bacterium]
MKKILSVPFISRALAAVLGIVAFFFMFGNQVKGATSGRLYTFQQTFFEETAYLKGSPLGFVGYLLILIGALCVCALAFVKVKKPFNYVCNCVAVVLLVLGAIFTFLIPSSVNTIAYITYNATTFPVLAGVFGLLATVLALVGFVFDEFVK